MNGSLHIEEKVKEIWDAGYRCAVVPSDLIDNGSLKLDAKNRPVFNGHAFRAMIYLYPQYAKRTTLAFLDEYTRRGGALMLEGSATREFDGSPIDQIFDAIATRARVRGFSADKIAELGVEKSPLRDEGGELEDGSVILTDLDSLETGQPKPFTVAVNGHQFSGAYVGVFALKAAASGRILKVACGGCQTISRDGHEVFRLRSATDVVLTAGCIGRVSRRPCSASQGATALRCFPDRYRLLCIAFSIPASASGAMIANAAGSGCTPSWLRFGGSPPRSSFMAE